MDPLATKVAQRVMAGYEDDERRGEWNLHLMKSRSRWGYSWTNPQGGGGGNQGYSSMRAAMQVAFKSVAWSKYAGGKTRVWVIVQEFDGSDWVTKKTFWQDIPEDLLTKEVKPLTEREKWDLMAR